MKYQHITTYWIKELALQHVESDEEIVLDSKIGFRAILTSNPDSYCFEGDRSLAVCVVILNRTLGCGKPGTFEESLVYEIKEIQESRKQKYGTGLYIICLTEGSIDKFEPSGETERDDFVICSGGVPIESINSASKPHTLAVLSSLMLSADNALTFVEASKSLVFFRDDGKPVYLISSSSSAESYTCSSITPEILKSVNNWYQILIADQEFDRVKQLLVSSLQTEGDKLRSFLSAWTALEVFINKTFSLYEKQFFKELSDGNYPNARNQYFERIQIVMKDKYRLIDKFSLITSLLSPESADEDIKFFKSAKEERDKLSHGQDLVEAALPVEEIQKLARKYLQLHLGI